MAQQITENEYHNLSKGISTVFILNLFISSQMGMCCSLGWNKISHVLSDYIIMKYKSSHDSTESKSCIIKVQLQDFIFQQLKFLKKSLLVQILPAITEMVTSCFEVCLFVIQQGRQIYNTS